MVLTVGEVAVRDVELKVSDINVAVSVSAAPALVDTERTHQSDTIERGQIASLPNLSRNFTSYIFTSAGRRGRCSGARAADARYLLLPTSGFSVGAGNGRSNYVSIDGGENESGDRQSEDKKP